MQAICLLCFTIQNGGLVAGNKTAPAMNVSPMTTHGRRHHAHKVRLPKLCFALKHTEAKRNDAGMYKSRGHVTTSRFQSKLPLVLVDIVRD